MNPFQAIGNTFGGLAGAAADTIGSTFHLPEVGLSEFLNVGNPTQNTAHPVGNVQIAPANQGAYNSALFQLPASSLQNYSVNAPSGAQGGAQGGTGINNIAPSYGGYGSAAAQQAAAQQAAAINAQKSQLNAQLGQLDNQQNIGLGNIGNSYNTSLQDLYDQNGRAKQTYDTQNAQNGQNYANTRNGILSNVHQTNNSLQRLLGLNGAGNSSAAFDLAPYAAALQGNQNLTQAQTAYGQNAQNLDNQWSQTQDSYNKSLDNLGQQKFQQEQGLKQSIAQTRANLLSQLQGADGSTAYQNQINSLLGQITGLGNNYQNAVKVATPVTFTTPDLAQYSLGKNVAPVSNNGGAQSDVGPSFLNVLTQKRDQFGNAQA
jgi:hypothetical protein